MVQEALAAQEVPEVLDLLSAVTPLAFCEPFELLGPPAPLELEDL
jgi:hypothetical protein